MNSQTKRIALIASASVVGFIGLFMIGAWLFFVFSVSTYENKKEGFAIKYPSGWTVNERPDPDVAVIFLGPKKNALQLFQDNVNFSTKDLSREPMTIEQYAEEVPKQMAAVFNKLSLTQKMFFDLGGHDAVRFFFKVSEEIEFMIVVYAFIYRDVAYNITYFGTAEQYAANRLKIEYMVSTMKLYF